MATTTRPAARKTPTKSRSKRSKAAATQPFTVRLPTKLTATVEEWTKEQGESKAQFVERALRTELREAGANERKPDHALVTAQIPVALRTLLDAHLSATTEQSLSDFVCSAIEHEIEIQSMTESPRTVTLQGLSTQILALKALISMGPVLPEMKLLRPMSEQIKAIALKVNAAAPTAGK